MNGVTAPVIASHGKLRSKRRQFFRVRDLHGALHGQRVSITPLEAAPWRRYSSNPPSKTPTSGLGRNCSATAPTSCRRCALRKARTKRPLCTRARRNTLHLERMIAQETRLKIRRSKQDRLGDRAGFAHQVNNFAADHCCQQRIQIHWFLGEFLPRL